MLIGGHAYKLYRSTSSNKSVFLLVSVYGTATVGFTSLAAALKRSITSLDISVFSKCDDV